MKRAVAVPPPWPRLSTLRALSVLLLLSLQGATVWPAALEGPKNARNGRLAPGPLGGQAVGWSRGNHATTLRSCSPANGTWLCVPLLARTRSQDPVGLIKVLDLGGWQGFVHAELEASTARKQ